MRYGAYPVAMSRGTMPARVVVAQRRAEVLRRRAAGQPYAQIAAELDPSGKYQPRHVATDYKRALEAAQRELADLAKLHLALELERLEESRRDVQAVITAAKAGGDSLMVLRATDRLTAISKRRDELLGLTRVTIEATKVTESGGERPHAEDSTDEVARKRAARRLAAARK